MKKLLTQVLVASSIVLTNCYAVPEIPVLHAKQIKLAGGNGHFNSVFGYRAILGEAPLRYQDGGGGNYTEKLRSTAFTYCKDALFSSKNNVLPLAESVLGAAPELELWASPVCEKLEMLIKNGRGVCSETNKFVAAIAQPGQISYEASSNNERNISGWYITVGQKQAHVDYSQVDFEKNYEVCIPLLAYQLSKEEQEVFQNNDQKNKSSKLPVSFTLALKIPSSHRLSTVCDWCQESGGLKRIVLRTYANWYGQNIAAGAYVQDPLIRFAIGSVAVMAVAGIAAKLVQAKKKAKHQAASGASPASIEQALVTDEQNSPMDTASRSEAVLAESN
jgi:hypothetical protein